MNTCPYCQATTRQNKAGKSEQGLQQYQCMHCNRIYVRDASWRSTVENIPEQSAAMQAYASAPSTLVPVTTSTAAPIQEFQPTLVPAEAERPLIVTHPAQEKRKLLPRVMDWSGTANEWGRLPEFAVLQAASLLFLAWAFLEARANPGSAEPWLWIGLAALILPTAYRLASAESGRRERLGLVLLLGMSLYLVKVMHNPVAFTFPDELSHLRNVFEVLRSHHLFQENPVQPVTAFYPGLPIVTSTLASLSGLSTFSAGVVVIGTARLILFLSLFLLFEHVSGSARVAGLGTLIYMANPNFLYWTAEYAYEPLALPMVVFVLLAVAKREAAEDRHHYMAWTVAALAGIFTVVITHHMSSYILTALLIALVVFYLVRSRGAQKGPWDLALVALVSTSVWLLLVANLTIDYLSPVFLGAIRSIFRLVAEEEQSRGLFTSGSSGRAAPIWEQIVGLGSVILIALGLPFGILKIRENYRDKIFALLLGAIALVYLPIQMLRFSKAGWETANRSSEFLFIGIGFVLALGIVSFGLSKWTLWKSQAVLAVLAVVLFFGGLIAGWPPRARLPHAYTVSAGNHLIQPQVVSVADWMLANLGPDRRIAAPKADAKMLGAYGQYPFTDNGSSIRTMFSSASVGPAETYTLSKRDVEFVISDRRVVSWDHMLGYYFYNPQTLEKFETQVVNKFDGLGGVIRVLDAGDIVVYDVRKYLAAQSTESEASSTNGRMP